MIEEKYGAATFCPHGMNAAMCPNCSHPRTTLCRHGDPVALCNHCGDGLADHEEGNFND